jgi:hypothetical protein
MKPNLKYILLVSLVLYGMLPALSLKLNPNKYEGGRSRDVRAEAERNTSAIGVIFGELRTSMADILFIKTERYLHSGAAFMPHLEENLLSISNKTDELAEHEVEVQEPDLEEDEFAHEQVAQSVIPSAEKDIRGFIGQLHRKVKPWMDPSAGHKHTTGAELLPWYRIMTISDPQNVRAYYLGAWWLKRINPDEALKFIREGVHNNPNSYQVHYMHGQILLDRANFSKEVELTEAEKEQYRNKAREEFILAGNMVLDRRPDAGPQENDLSWTEYMEEDARATMRSAVITEARYGSKETANELAKKYLNELGNDGILQRYVLE